VIWSLDGIVDKDACKLLVGSTVVPLGVCAEGLLVVMVVVMTGSLCGLAEMLPVW
jgi:hypothetical protein